MASISIWVKPIKNNYLVTIAKNIFFILQQSDSELKSSLKISFEDIGEHLILVIQLFQLQKKVAAIYWAKVKLWFVRYTFKDTTGIIP